jgi:solute carrier family 25 (mitochondrial phosphate transporter), member 3
MATKEKSLPFGKIEPYSTKYFTSCALGGIIGMLPNSLSLMVLLTIFSLRFVYTKSSQ